jgi:hypothetical protein
LRTEARTATRSPSRTRDFSKDIEPDNPRTLNFGQTTPIKITPVIPKARMNPCGCRNIPQSTEAIAAEPSDASGALNQRM